MRCVQHDTWVNFQKLCTTRCMSSVHTPPRSWIGRRGDSRHELSQGSLINALCHQGEKTHKKTKRWLLWWIWGGGAGTPTGYFFRTRTTRNRKVDVKLETEVLCTENYASTAAAAASRLAQIVQERQTALTPCPAELLTAKFSAVPQAARHVVGGGSST